MVISVERWERPFVGVQMAVDGRAARRERLADESGGVLFVMAEHEDLHRRHCTERPQCARSPPRDFAPHLPRYDPRVVMEVAQVAGAERDVGTGRTDGQPLVGMTGRRWPGSVLGDRVAAPIGAGEVDLHFADYSRAVAVAGALPVGLSRDASVGAIVERIDGIVLSGGADVDPAGYGQQRLPECGTVEEERDAWELALVDAAMVAGVPVFGICRGIQVLNVAFGGTLIQHLPLLAGSAVEGHQRDDVTRGATAHAVKFEPGSLAASLYGTERQVNSLHHQAVDRLGSGLVASGHASDGTVEAVELPGALVLGVQWHPEMLVHVQPDPGFIWLVARASERMSAQPRHLGRS